MTYRRDSDIVLNFGLILPKNASKIPDFKPGKWMNFTPPMQKHYHRFSRPKDILWIVSHCDVWSKRDQYVEELKKVTKLEIDIFGKCGDKKLPRKNLEVIENTKKQYKFYLSFENSLCKDYVTEKLYHCKRGSQKVIIASSLK